jgi:polysaccharide pyruvyl transferase CsaB
MNSKPPLKIVISGWYGHWNAGDDAILQVFIEQVTSRLKCNIVVLSERPENIHKTNQVSGIFHLLPSIKGIIRSLIDGSFLRHLKNIRSCDLFVLGGGGLLRDNTNWRNLIRLLDEVWISKLFGRKVMLYAIGVGPFKSRLGKLVIGASVKMCDLITVRSENDACLLREIGVASERIHVVADPAFLLQPEVPKDQALVEILSQPRKIGLFPTFSLIMEGQDFSHVIRLAAALDKLAEHEGLQFVILPMQVSESSMDDVQMANAIKSAMKHPEAIQIYEKRLTPSELKWATNKTLLNITLRLHAMIFSLGANAPVVAINYEPKVGNVFGALNCPQFLVEMDDSLDTTLVSAVKQCLTDLPNYAQIITEFSPAARMEASRTFELMLPLFQ